MTSPNSALVIFVLVVALSFLLLVSSTVLLTHQHQISAKKHHNISTNDVRNALKQLREADKQRAIRSQLVTLPNGSRVAFSQLPPEVQESLIHNNTSSGK